VQKETIGQQMASAPLATPDSMRLKQVERQLADPTRWYNELRELFFAATGIDWTPAELWPEGPATLTTDDKALLKSMGITL
jgi:hypothetical protein